MKPRHQRALEKVAAYWAIAPTPEQVARLAPSQVFLVPTVGRRSVERIEAWLAAHGLRFGTGDSVPRPPGRTIYDRPWPTRGAGGRGVVPSPPPAPGRASTSGRRS